MTQSELQPGQIMTAVQTKNDFEYKAYDVSEGQRLYQWYNCAGCHFNGGGGIGPPLMDKTWIYGGDPQNIFSTIVEGRPNGMPSFRGKIPDYQVWQIVAYVRSLSKQLPKDVLPGRGDTMNITSQPSQMGAPKPTKQSSQPPSTVQSK